MEQATIEERRKMTAAARAKRWAPKDDPAPVKVVERQVGEDGVRQHHGVTAEGTGNVRIWETLAVPGFVAIRVFDGVSGVERNLNPATARYLADELYALARRVEQRRVGR